MSNLNREIENGVKTAFIDYTEASGQTYRPKFIYNDYKKGKKVVSALEDELALLLNSLKELEEKGVNVQILRWTRLSHQGIYIQQRGHISNNCR